MSYGRNCERCDYVDTKKYYNGEQSDDGTFTLHSCAVCGKRLCSGCRDEIYFQKSYHSLCKESDCYKKYDDKRKKYNNKIDSIIKDKNTMKVYQSINMFI